MTAIPDRDLTDEPLFAHLATVRPHGVVLRMAIDKATGRVRPLGPVALGPVALGPDPARG